MALCLALLALPARADEAVDPYQMIKTFKTTPREPMTVVATPVSAPAPMPPAAPHKLPSAIKLLIWFSVDSVSQVLFIPMAIKL